MKVIQISVVIPAYNAELYIFECLDSVFKQEDSPAFEVIVVDDGSIDKTSDIVKQQFPLARIFKKNNGGPGSARNFGVFKALGDIIIFTDADDIMLPGRLASQGRFMLMNPEIGLSVGNLQYQSRPEYDSLLARGICESLEFTEVKSAYVHLLTNENFVGAGITAVRKEAYLGIGGQPEGIWVGEDYAMGCAIAKRWPIAATRRFLTWYRQGHGDNLMASSHTYQGPVFVLYMELCNHGQRLTPEQYQLAFGRWCAGANILLRWVWSEAGHKAVLAEMTSLRPLLPARLYVKWFVLSMLPSSVGRSLRSAKRWVKQLGLNGETTT